MGTGDEATNMGVAGTGEVGRVRDRVRPRFLLLLAGVLAAWLVASTAIASAAGCDDWTGGAGDGLWTSSGNWSAGVPGSGTDACIELSGTYTVTLEGDQSANSLTLGGTSGTQTLDVVNGPTAINSALTLGADSMIDEHGRVVLDSQNSSGLAELDRSGTGPTLTNDGTIDTQVEAGGDYLALNLDNAGTLEIKTGELNWNTSSTTLTNSGTLKVDSGATLAQTSGSASFLNDTGGSVVNDGSLTAVADTWAQDGGSESGNTVQLSGGPTYSDTGSSAEGSFDITGAATVSGTVGPNETLYVLGLSGGRSTSTSIAAGGATNDGTIVLDSPNGDGPAMLGASDEPAGATWTNNGTIDTQVEGTGNGDYLETNLDNTGTVEVKTGGFDWGPSSQTFTNGGNLVIDAGATLAATAGGQVFTQQATGTLTVHVASGSNFGTLSSVDSNQIKLAGTLAVSFDNGFNPAADETLAIITASGTDVTSGGFSRVTPGVAPNGLALAPQYSGTGNGVSLEFETPSIVADTGAQSAPAGSPFAQDLEATVTDASGPVSGAMVTFTAPSSGPTGTFTGGFSSVTESTDSNGVATAPTFTANASQGTYTVTASAPEASSQASFDLSNLAPGQPGVSLSAPSLDFGTVGLGASSAPETVTVTNTGSAPLELSSAAITGASPADFHESGDSCTGQSIATGGHCSVSIQFEPTADGARAAALVFFDNTAGSPQSVPLEGTGTSLGSVSGTIVDGSISGDPPVLGAEVSICPTTFITLACQSESSPSGNYAFAGLTPGTWYMQVNPLTASLFTASAIVNVPRGSVTQNFTLTAPAPPPRGVAVNGAFGSGTGGVPVINWNGPTTVTYQPGFPSEPAGTTIVYITIVGVFPAESDNSAPLTSGSMLTVVEYRAGKPVVEAQYADPTSGAEPTMTFTNKPPPSAPTGGSGIVVQYLPTSGEIQADITLHGQLHGPVQIDIESAYATYAAGSFSRDPLEARDRHARLGATRRSIAHAAQAPGGPVQYYQEYPPDGPDLYGPGGPGLPYPVNLPTVQNPCPPGTVAVVAPGPGGGGGGGGGDIREDQVRGAPNDQPPPIDFPSGIHGVYCHQVGGYADPSGSVVTTNGAPVPAATVRLLHASTPSGPFQAVPSGSVIMSPSNRRDPDKTNAFGLFGWDVLPGYYRVTAKHPGCTAPSGGPSAKTRVYPIPPPVDNLRLKLRCPRLHRARAQLALQLRSFRHGMTVVTAILRGSHPGGLMTFIAGKLHVTIPLDQRTHRAIFETPRAAAHVTVRYLGDGYTQPSSRRVKL